MGDRKVAVITGAAKGLGKGYTEALLKKRYKVSHSKVDMVSTKVTLIPGYLELFRNRSDRNCFSGGILIYITAYLND